MNTKIDNDNSPSATDEATKDRSWSLPWTCVECNDVGNVIYLILSEKISQTSLCHHHLMEKKLMAVATKTILVK